MDAGTEAAGEPPFRGWLWGVLGGAVALVLVVRGVEAHQRNADLHRRVVRTQAELDLLGAEQNRMREELRALHEDPLYIESMLKRRPAGDSSVPVVEK
jgi:hypothetical protein